MGTLYFLSAVIAGGALAFGAGCAFSAALDWWERR